MNNDEFNDAMVCAPIVATLIGFAGEMSENLAVMINSIESSVAIAVKNFALGKLFPGLP